MDDGKREEQSISINDLEYLPVTKTVKESMRVQRTEYIRQQMRRRQEDEDARMVQLMQEQRVIEGMRRQINENIELTEAGSKYNQEFKESMNAQIYALHGISADKLEGMREYKNAYYQGCTAALFLLSVGLFILSGLLHGFQSEICVFMLSYTGIEGALLAQEDKRWKAVNWLCRKLYLFLFPVMLLMFVSYELYPSKYQWFLPYATLSGILVLGFSVVSYFLYNPYRRTKKQAREAQRQIIEVEKTAKKEVRKNQKKHEKEAKKTDKYLKKEDRRQERRMRRENRLGAVKSFFRSIGHKTAGLFHFGSRKESMDMEVGSMSKESMDAETESMGEENMDAEAASMGGESMSAEAVSIGGKSMDVETQK